VHARLQGSTTIVTVPAYQLEPWRASVNEFRDRHLVSFNQSVSALQVKAVENFSLSWTNSQWWISPQDFAGDGILVTNFLKALAGMQVEHFVKDVVTEPDLPAYGLAQPIRQYTLRTAETNSSGSVTQAVMVELHFGTNQEDRVFTRRTDENSVYAVSLQDFQRLPARALDLRDRRIWAFEPKDVDRAIIRQSGKTRHLVRAGDHNWSLAPGSQGIINDVAVEETVQGLGKLSAHMWVSGNETNRAAYGLTPESLQITLEFKNGTKQTVQFGREAPSTFPYAEVTLEGQPWILEFPWALFRDVMSYLSIPQNVP
jgi:hypothetical protein